MKRLDAFAREFLLVPQGSGSLTPFRLRPWQKTIVNQLIPARGLRPRQGVITLPRGNGKSGLSAVLACYFLFGDGVEGAEVCCVANDERQARIIFNRVRRMVELNPRLADQVQVFQDRIYLPHTDSALFPLPAEESALQGFSPTFAVVDELAFGKEEIWSAMTLASGKRDHSLVLGISTPGTDRDSILWRLVDYGRNHPEDKSFSLTEIAAPLDAGIHDEAAWKQANPALGDFLSIDALRLDARTTREDNFKRFRMGLWVSGASAWLPAQDWAACADPDRVVNHREPVVLGFDGSISDDSTALTGCTIAKAGEKPHVFVIHIWGKDEPGWQVDRDEVDATVHEAFKRYNVTEAVCDPYGWRSDIQRWSKKYGSTRVLEFPSYIYSRMGPFTDSLATAVKQQQMTHDGNEVLAQHVANARAKQTSAGDVIVKDRKHSPRKIDSAVTSIMSFGRANWHSENPARKRRLMSV